MEWRWAGVGRGVHRGRWGSGACSSEGQELGRWGLHQECCGQAVTVGDEPGDYMLWVGGWGRAARGAEETAPHGNREEKALPLA